MLKFRRVGGDPLIDIGGDRQQGVWISTSTLFAVTLLNDFFSCQTVLQMAVFVKDLHLCLFRMAQLFDLQFSSCLSPHFGWLGWCVSCSWKDVVPVCAFCVFDFQKMRAFLIEASCSSLRCLIGIPVDSLPCPGGCSLIHSFTTLAMSLAWTALCVVLVVHSCGALMHSAVFLSWHSDWSARSLSQSLGLSIHMIIQKVYYEVPIVWPLLPCK